MKHITTKTSNLPGKTVAIFAGIHGDETAGIEALNIAIEKITPDTGTIHFVLGNPRAIKTRVRYTATNLNRDFLRINTPKSYEQKRAQELMDLLDTCDALLDLHAYREPNGEAIPFCICEPQCFPLARKLPITKILSNITSFQDGSTNGYMDNQGKIGVVVELGAIETPEKYINLGVECIQNFLNHFKIVSDSYPIQREQEYLTVTGVYRKNLQEFSFTQKRKSFDIVTANEVIATDGPLTIQANTDGQILFPNSNGPTGVESFWFLSKT